MLSDDAQGSSSHPAATTLETMQIEGSEEPIQTSEDQKAYWMALVSPFPMNSALPSV